MIKFRVQAIETVVQAIEELKDIYGSKEGVEGLLIQMQHVLQRIEPKDVQAIQPYLKPRSQKALLNTQNNSSIMTKMKRAIEKNMQYVTEGCVGCGNSTVTAIEVTKEQPKRANGSFIDEQLDTNALMAEVEALMNSVEVDESAIVPATMTILDSPKAEQKQPTQSNQNNKKARGRKGKA